MYFNLPLVPKTTTTIPVPLPVSYSFANVFIANIGLIRSLDDDSHERGEFSQVTHIYAHRTAAHIVYDNWQRKHSQIDIEVVGDYTQCALVKLKSTHSIRKLNVDGIPTDN